MKSPDSLLRRLVWSGAIIFTVGAGVLIGHRWKIGIAPTGDATAAMGFIASGKLRVNSFELHVYRNESKSRLFFGDPTGLQELRGLTRKVQFGGDPVGKVIEGRLRIGWHVVPCGVVTDGSRVWLHVSNGFLRDGEYYQLPNGIVENWILEQSLVR